MKAVSNINLKVIRSNSSDRLTTLICPRSANLVSHTRNACIRAFKSQNTLALKYTTDDGMVKHIQAAAIVCDDELTCETIKYTRVTGHYSHNPPAAECIGNQGFKGMKKVDTYVNNLTNYTKDILTN